MNLRKELADIKRLVVKVGSNVVTKRMEGVTLEKCAS